MHAAKLVKAEADAIKPFPVLPEEDRAFALELYQEGAQHEKRREQQERRRPERNVNAALACEVNGAFS